MDFDWKKMVGSVAPVLGTALGGPFGGMAGKFIADALGTDVDSLPEVIAGATPEQMMAVKNADHDFKIQMKELGITEEQMHQKDRDSARNMAISTTLKPQAIIATVFIIGFIAVLYTVFSGELKMSDQQTMLANVLLGILSAGVMQVMNFFFGSSSGSKEKTNILGTKQ